MLICFVYKEYDLFVFHLMQEQPKNLCLIVITLDHTCSKNDKDLLMYVASTKVSPSDPKNH